MIPDFSTRTHRDEWIDDPSLDPEKLQRTLDDLAALNARIGGHLPSVSGVERLAGERQKLTVLDVGTGSGDLPRILVDRARRRGVKLDVTGIDLSDAIVDHARNRAAGYPEVNFRRCDLFDLDDDETYDVVHASLMVHHLDDQQAAAGLRKMYELCRLGVVINDLHRHPVSYFGSFALLRLLSDNPIIHHDGSLSILRGFRRDELHKLAEQAGVGNTDIRWFPLFRWRLLAHR